VATIALIAAACSAAEPTPIYVYLTPTPVVATPTPEPTPEPTPTPTPEPTPEPTPTPGDTGSPEPTPTPTATPTPTPTPTPGPTGPADACTGSAGNREFFLQAANVLSFNVYCGSLPSGWYLSAASYEQPNGGFLKISYKGPGGAVLALAEGNFCSGSSCAPSTGHVGNAKFGDLSGSLESVSGGFAVYVSPGTTKAYSATGTGVSQATFVALTAAFKHVPKT
jgi:hypothetical protein